MEVSSATSRILKQRIKTADEGRLVSAQQARQRIKSWLSRSSATKKRYISSPWLKSQNTASDVRGSVDSARYRAATERTGGVVATCSYNLSMEAGVRGLKDNLSRYTRRIEAGAS